MGCPKETLEKLLQLEAAHAAMLIRFKRKLQRRVKPKDLVDFVFSFLEQCKPNLMGRNIDKAFQLLSLHTDTFNTHILHCAATALNNAPARELVSEYDKKKDVFLHDTRVEDFKQVVRDRVAPQEFTSGSIVQLKLTGKWPERTLKDVEYLVNVIFGVKAQVFLKPTYRDGCTEITWYAPHCDWMELHEIALAKSAVAFVQEVKSIGFMTFQSHVPSSGYMHFIHPSPKTTSGSFGPPPASPTNSVLGVNDDFRKRTNSESAKPTARPRKNRVKRTQSLSKHGCPTRRDESTDFAQLAHQHSWDEQSWPSPLERSASNLSLRSSTQSMVFGDVDAAAVSSTLHDSVPWLEHQGCQSSRRDSVISNVSSSSVSSSIVSHKSPSLLSLIQI